MKVRPFAVAVVVMIFIVTPGFIRIQQITAEQNRAAKQACQTRNTFQANTRTKFIHFNDAIELAFTSRVTDPERLKEIKAFIQQLRNSVETDPYREDFDCNKDHKLNKADYLP